MRILIIGGTRFVGRHFVQAALDRGHTITLFNRGKSGADVFPGVETIYGDRDNAADLASLRGHRWDSVLDTCAYIPRHVAMLTDVIRDSTPHYTLISTISVYADPVAHDADESAPLKALDDETTEQVTNETYGGLKVLCERAASASRIGTVLNIRPGLIVGPYDHTDRFTYWVERIARGGDVLVPGDLARRVQFIDGRDLGEWMVRMTERGVTGTFNAVNPPEPTTWRDWLADMRDAFTSDARLHAVSDEFLESHAMMGGDLPFWVPAPHDGVLAVSNAAARAHGLTARSTARIARDTLAWNRTRGGEALKAGLSPERERELLAAAQA
jgi:2'-hydroxyisoflavone reductase